MTSAYCTLAEVKSSMSGDVPNVGTSHDQSLVSKILEVSRDIDRQVAHARGEPIELFSFLADQIYGRQIIYLSATPTATDGVLSLTFNGETTVPIVFDADAETVRVALTAVMGTGNVLVSGNPGGPWIVDFAGSLAGPQATISGHATVDVSDAVVVVLPVVYGVPTVPSERRFYSSSPLYGSLLPIDDCVDILSVTMYDSNGAPSDVLVEGPDYQRYPLRGLPVEGLKRAGGWPEWPKTVGVTARWGYATAVPEDVREVAVIEVIRGHLGALAGNDDRLGMTPFGSIMTAKAFTSKFKELVATYGSKLW